MVTDVFCIRLKDNTFVGHAGCLVWPQTQEVELGYAISKAFWGKGYVTEAAQTLIAWIFKTTTLEYIIAFAFIENLASQKVLEKIGMKFVENKMVDGVELAFYKLARALK